jgi:AcrR family transcriptional regulator
MADVAVAAGMARSTLYRYFRDRDELVISVIEREAVALVSELLPELQKLETMQEFILEGTLMALQEIEKHPIMADLVTTNLGFSQHVLLATDRLIRIGVEVTQPALEQARETGIVRENVQVEQVIDWILRILISILNMPSEATSTEARRRDLLRNMLLPAIFTE